MFTQLRRIAFCLLFFPLVSLFSQEVTEGTLDPNEWVIETYQLPSDGLVRGFVSEERGSLFAPPLPPKDAGEKEIQAFIKKSSSIVSHYLEIKGMALPKGALVIYDPESMTLTARLPRISQSSVAFACDDFRSSAEKYLGVDQTIFQAPAGVLRDIADRASGKSDHTEFLEELEAAVAKGTAKLLTYSRTECRSGNRTKITHSGHSTNPQSLVLNQEDEIGYTSDELSLGTIFEMDPVLGADDETIDMNFQVKYDYAPPQRRMVNFTKRGKATIASAVTETFDVDIVSQNTSLSGTSKILGIWSPHGLGGAGDPKVLQVAFSSIDVVEVLPLPNKSLQTMLETHGEKVTPTPAGKVEFKKAAEEIPDGMIVRRYRIPPTFLSGGSSAVAAVAAVAADAADPFAPAPYSEPRFTVRVTAKDILKAAGIPFPPGSSANYLPRMSTLVVRNFPQHIQLVEAYIMVPTYGPEKSIAMTIHIVEGPTKLMRAIAKKTRSLPDHTPEWDALQEEKGFSILTTNWIEARSGNRTKIETGKNYKYPVASTSVSQTGKGDKEKTIPIAELSGDFDETRIGSIFEVDPVLGADGKTIEINLAIDYDYAPPTEGNLSSITPEAINLDGPEVIFHEAKLTTQITIRSGMMRLIGLWKPSGTPELDKADVLQAVFLKADVIRLKADEED